ncbi:hypothetical protein BS47DRAFT_898076 [Hydnum rufescens UP504]|uniref:BAG domain-containing protein n=1 Tax=Hydnum rufescens UP504 TaxID=1448309 RepID=A0A9P6AZA7_9AGAM|nr:hypothetical protein BS47DRAFT_898076 [Hydnum rufescens UP504]
MFAFYPSHNPLYGDPYAVALAQAHGQMRAQKRERRLAEIRRREEEARCRIRHEQPILDYFAFAFPRPSEALRDDWDPWRSHPSFSPKLRCSSPQRRPTKLNHENVTREPQEGITRRPSTPGLIEIPVREFSIEFPTKTRAVDPEAYAVAASKIQAAWRARSHRIHALEQITSIHADFSSLRELFTFPHHLDFDRHSSLAAGEPASPYILLYSSQNVSLHSHLHMLDILLTRLDAVQSFGDAKVRHARKQTASAIESYARELEERIQREQDTAQSVSSDERAVESELTEGGNSDEDEWIDVEDPPLGIWSLRPFVDVRAT